MTTGEALGRLAYEMWGSKGVPVFPCGDKGEQRKVPLCRWKQEATCNEQEIIDLFSSRGSRAKYIGAAMGEKAGLFALDFDLYKGAKARQYLDTLAMAGLLPPTRVHETMSGGLHYIYFAPDGAPCPRNSVPHDGVEVRGEGGYIVVPPTPGYKVQSSETNEAPLALVKRLARADAAFKSLSVSGLVQKIIAGDSFHEALVGISAKLHSKGEAPAAVLKVMRDAMEGSVAADPRHHRHSRWLAIMEGEDGELGRLAESAFRKYNPRKDQLDVAVVASEVTKAGRNRDVTLGGFFAPIPNGFGGKPLPKGAEGAAEPKPGAKTAPPAAPDEFPFSNSYAVGEVDEQENKNFLLYPLIMEGDVVVLSAEPKAGKTLTAMSICLHAAAGVAFGDMLMPLDSQGQLRKIPVVYFALEGQGAIRKRIKAWLMHYKTQYGLKLTREDIRLFVVERPINLAEGEAKQELVDKLMLADAYFQKQGWGKMGMVVFDTLTKAMPGKDQNSVEDTSEVFNVIDMMREVNLNPAVMFVHHNNKNSKAPRGSSNILAEPDTILSVSKIPAVVLQGVTVRCVEMSVYMARTIDDAQVYRMASLDIEIGKNSQGIMESAPVQHMLEDYTAMTTPAQETIKVAGGKAKKAFYDKLYVTLADAPDMTMTLGRLARSLRDDDAAFGYYSQHVNSNTRDGAMAAWAVLLNPKQMPNNMQGISFSTTETHIQMEIDLGHAAQS